jgi:hypothetical protein
LFHLFPKKIGFQLFLLENNNLITGTVMIATVIMNEEMPDKRQFGLVHEYRVSLII